MSTHEQRKMIVSIEEELKRMTSLLSPHEQRFNPRALKKIVKIKQKLRLLRRLLRLTHLGQNRGASNDLQ